MPDDIIDSDPVFGGSHHEPAGTEDPILGGQPTPSAPEPPKILSRGWFSLADAVNHQPPPSETPIRDLARNAVAAETRGATRGLDLLTNPSQMIIGPLATAGAAGYDWL